jgi:hypothetical protein
VRVGDFFEFIFSGDIVLSLKREKRNQSIPQHGAI